MARDQRPTAPERPRARPQPPPAPPITGDVDDGWDDGPVTAPPRATTAEPAERSWGDDSDAPTPEVALAADLPPEPPADDLDPATSHWLDDDAPPERAGGERAAVRNPIGIKFTTAGKIYLFDAGDETYRVGETVVVDTERGPRVANVAVAGVRREITRGPLRRVLRRPSKNDQKNLDRNRDRDREILRVARDLAREIDLPVKVFRAELSLGGAKAIVYFSTDDKIDARRLARELTTSLHLRIELRQTGVRDEAKMVGGIGSCGLELCCTTWLPAFVPVSIKNAKDQGLVLNPSKVSGQCGRLKCCLVYEQETYAELRKGLPKLGKRVVTDQGEGRVVEVDVLRQRVRVSLVQGDVQVYAANEVRPMFPSQQQGQRRPEPEAADAADDDTDS
ncbi:MAG TPA: regulatory iron-sulfur-containing complex subunit RicT [Kofleriaceae bacterium]